MTNDLRRLVNREWHVFMILLSIVAAIMLHPGSTLAQIPAVSDADWITFNRTLQGDRYSPLKEITIANVKNLAPVAAFDTQETANFETGLIVVDGIMYFTTYETTYAIDAITGQLKWRRSHPDSSPSLRNNRGVAYADGMIFRGFNDGHFVAMRATDGSVVWEKVLSDPAKGESLPMAPIAWDGKVFVGRVHELPRACRRPVRIPGYWRLRGRGGLLWRGVFADLLLMLAAAFMLALVLPRLRSHKRS